jgi:hypothetical protein
MPPCIVEHQQDDAAQARFGFLGKGCEQSLENVFDTPSETYQKVSPVAVIQTP